MTIKKEKPIINCKYYKCNKEFKQTRKDKLYCNNICRKKDWKEQQEFNKSIVSGRMEG